MVNGVLTDMDSLFDTRLPIAYILNKHEAQKAVKSGRYRLRFKDNIGNIPHDVLRCYYRIRTKNIFELALPTYVFSTLQEHVMDVMSDKLTEDNVLIAGINLYVNTYPYDFTDNELKLLKEAIENEIPKTIVTMIRMSEEELTSEWVQKHVNLVIMYDLLMWLEYQVAKGDLVDYPLLEVSAIAPALINNDTHGEKLDFNFFEEIKEVYSKIIDIAYAPSSIFSSVILEPEFIKDK